MKFESCFIHFTCCSKVPISTNNTVRKVSSLNLFPFTTVHSAQAVECNAWIGGWMNEIASEEVERTIKLNVNYVRRPLRRHATWFSLWRAIRHAWWERFHPRFICPDVANLGGRRPSVAVGLPSIDKSGFITVEQLSFLGIQNGKVEAWQKSGRTRLTWYKLFSPMGSVFVKNDTVQLKLCKAQKPNF